MEKEGGSEIKEGELAKRKWDLVVIIIGGIIVFLFGIFLSMIYIYIVTLQRGDSNILTTNIHIFWLFFSIVIFFIIMFGIWFLYSTKKRDLVIERLDLTKEKVTFKTTLQNEFDKLKITLQSEYDTKNEKLEEGYAKKLKGLDDKYVTDYPCVVKNFETFVTNYYITIVENSENSLYNVTFLICDNLKPNKKDIFERASTSFVNSYQEYKNKLVLQCMMPKKLERKEFDKYVKEFKRIVVNSKYIL